MDWSIREIIKPQVSRVCDTNLTVRIAFLTGEGVRERLLLLRGGDRLQVRVRADDKRRRKERETKKS